MIASYLTSRVKYDHIVLLGDFNDNPDDRSLNILEYGDPDAPGGIDDTPDAFLFNTTESLLDFKLLFLWIQLSPRQNRKRHL